MAGKPIVHVEIPAKDPAAAARFYHDVFNWEYEEVPEMRYITFKTGADQGGGFPEIDNHMYRPDNVIVYIDCDDIEATLQQIEKLGGKTVVPKSPIPGMGWFAHFTDPSGNRIALFTDDMDVK